MHAIVLLLGASGFQLCAGFSTSGRRDEKKKFPLLIIGGGAGGQAMSYKLMREFGKGNVAVLEPSDVKKIIGDGIHYNNTSNSAHKNSSVE